MPWFRRHQHSYDQIVNPQTEALLTTDIAGAGGGGSSAVHLYEHTWTGQDIYYIATHSQSDFYMVSQVQSGKRIVPVQVQIAIKQGSIPWTGGYVYVFWGAVTIAQAVLSPVLNIGGFTELQPFQFPFAAYNSQQRYLLNYDDSTGPYLYVSSGIPPAPSTANGTVTVRMLYTLQTI